MRVSPDIFDLSSEKIEKGGERDSHQNFIPLEDEFEIQIKRLEKCNKTYILPFFMQNFKDFTFPANSASTTIGTNIKALRVAYGLKQQELAKLAGIGCNTLKSYENNQTCKTNPWIIQNIACALKVKDTELLNGSLTAQSQNIFDYLVRTTPDTFGAKIKNLRLKHKIQQKELAEFLGVHRETIRRYENNLTKPDKKKVLELEKILT